MQFARLLDAMRAVLSGRDALVVLPTGGGKSAIYQVPGTLLPGPTVVVSPLLALQQDQMAALSGRGDPRLAAVRLSSAESAAERRAALDALSKALWAASSDSCMAAFCWKTVPTANRNAATSARMIDSMGQPRRSGGRLRAPGMNGSSVSSSASLPWSTSCRTARWP